MVVDSFYENVPLHVKEHREHRPGENPQNVVVRFMPTPAQPMLISCLWSHWVDPTEPDIKEVAEITDDPPPEVLAAGQDRCIINLRPEHVDAWLMPERRTSAELQAILSNRAISTFEHAALQAA